MAAIDTGEGVMDCSLLWYSEISPRMGCGENESKRLFVAHSLLVKMSEKKHVNVLCKLMQRIISLLYHM